MRLSIYQPILIDMSSKKEKIATLAIMSMIASMSSDSSLMITGDANGIRAVNGKKPSVKRPPNGTNQYYFKDDGSFETSSINKERVVFECVAINDKNAIRKYEKWKLNNPHTAG